MLNEKNKKTIGIIGGMGPLATCDLFKKIIEKNQNAKCDQEYIHVCIDCNTNIPDRTEAILNGGENPVPEIVKSSILLESMGANVLVMPCNTAHYFYDKITPFLNIPLLNMPDETAKKLKQENVKKIGLLATDGTIKSNVYHCALEKYGIETLTPSAVQQKSVMDIIYKGVKAGNKNIDLTDFYATIDSLLKKGAELLILGCTELPVAFDIFHIDRPSIDATSVLAEAAVRFVDSGLLLTTAS